jgi:hypothetical protein
MSGVVNTFWKGASKIWNEAIGDSVEELRLSKDTGWHTKPRRPKQVAPRRLATIDEARERQLEDDRIGRRRGVLANVYGGATGMEPTVDVKVLSGGTGLLAG